MKYVCGSCGYISEFDSDHYPSKCPSCHSSDFIEYDEGEEYLDPPDIEDESEHDSDIDSDDQLLKYRCKFCNHEFYSISSLEVRVCPKCHNRDLYLVTDDDSEEENSEKQKSQDEIHGMNHFKCGYCGEKVSSDSEDISDEICNKCNHKEYLKISNDEYYDVDNQTNNKKIIDISCPKCEFHFPVHSNKGKSRKIICPKCKNSFPVYV